MGRPLEPEVPDGTYCPWVGNLTPEEGAWRPYVAASVQCRNGPMSTAARLVPRPRRLGGRHGGTCGQIRPILRQRQTFPRDRPAGSRRPTDFSKRLWRGERRLEDSEWSGHQVPHRIDD